MGIKSAEKSKIHELPPGTPETSSAENIVNRYAFVALIILSFFPLWTALTYNHSVLDDAYITLTYAKCLSRGQGFVYNHPPATLGTTTPLLALIVASIAHLMPRIDIARIAVFFTTLCWIATGWVPFLVRCAFRLKPWQAAIVSMVILFTAWPSFLGMEMYLFAFLLVLGIALFFSGHIFLCGLSIGFLCLTRGEGVLLLAITACCLAGSSCNKATIKRTKNFLRELRLLLAGFIIPVAAWSIYAYLMFGTAVPATLSAKRAQLQTGIWKSFFYELSHTWIHEWGRDWTLGGLPYLNFWWLLLFVGIGFAVIYSRRFLLFFIWAVVYGAAYSFLGVPGYVWYQFSLIFSLQIFVALGLIACCVFFLSKTRWPTVNALAACLLVVFFMGVFFRTSVCEVRKDPVVHIQGQEKYYPVICKWFNENTNPSASVAYIEVGYLGYYTDNKIIDLAGLITPGLDGHIKKSDFAWGFWQHNPDYYIWIGFFDWALYAIRNDPKFDELYERVATISYGIEIYKRKGATTLHR